MNTREKKFKKNENSKTTEVIKEGIKRMYLAALVVFFSAGLAKAEDSKIEMPTLEVSGDTLMLGSVDAETGKDKKRQEIMKGIEKVVPGFGGIILDLNELNQELAAKAVKNPEIFKQAVQEAGKVTNDIIVASNK